MSTALWIIQVILGIKLITVSYTHGFHQSLTTMQEAIQEMGKLSRLTLFGVAACTFIGTLGLILPGLLGLSTWITPVIALILAIMLLVSIFFHIKFREKPKIFVSIVLFVFAAFITYGRWAFIH